MVGRLRAVALERRLVAVDLRAVVLAAFAAGALRVAPVLRGAARLAAGFAEAVDLVDDEDELSSSVHLPDITRWAASATASAISEPSFDALLIMVEAALLALSAASRPASRMALRALGLAAIAAAAAVRPAASISRLIAAFAILSRLDLVVLDVVEALLFLLPLLRVVDFAMVEPPVESIARKDGPEPKRFPILVKRTSKRALPHHMAAPFDMVSDRAL